jgi:hypothetical protein
MSLLPPPADKYDFTGIGDASALAVLAILSANPTTAGMTVGVWGTLLKLLLSKLFSALASVGVVFLNVGAELVTTVVLKSDFGGTMDSSLALLSKLQAAGSTLTPEQIKAIDDPVIAAFEKFAKLTRTKS